MEFLSAFGRRARIRIVHPALLLLAVPLFFSISYHVLNHRYPVEDAGDYFAATQDIYRTFQMGGWWAGIQDLYWVRSYKAIAHTSAAVPFLMLAGGKALFGVALALVFFQGVFIFNLYRFLRIYLEPVWAALGGTTIAMSPPILGTSYGFMVEIFFLACAMGAFRSYVLANDFTDTKWTRTFTFWFLASTLMRPVVTLLVFSGPLAISFFQLLRRTVPLNGVAKRNLILAMAFYVVGVVAWFAPFFENLLFWIGLSTFSERATSHIMSRGVGPLVLFRKLVEELGGAPLALLAISAFFAWVSARFGQRTYGEVSGRLKVHALAFVAAMIVPVLMGASTANRDLRYYYFGLSVLLAVLLVLTLRREGRAYWLRASAVLAVLSLHVAYAGHFVYRWSPWDVPGWEAMHSAAKSCPECHFEPLRTSDRSVAIYEQLVMRIPEMDQTTFFVLLDSTSVQAGRVVDFTFPLRAVSLEHGKNWRFILQVMFSEINTADLNGLKSMLARGDYDCLLYGPTESEFREAKAALSNLAHISWSRFTISERISFASEKDGLPLHLALFCK